MNDLRSMLRDHWTALDTTPQTGRWLTSALPVEVEGRPLLCAVGPQGNHHLLVPLGKPPLPRPDTRSTAVHLVPLVLEDGGRTINYANLTLLREDLEEVFAGLCADVIGTIASMPSDPLLVVTQVLEGWRELLRSGTQLGVEQLAGIYGELCVLGALLDMDQDMISCWKGPLRAAQDFIAGDRAVEVKATASAEGRIARIHGLDQLAPPPGGLMLWWIRFSTSDGAGTTLPELAESTARRVPRPREFWQLLSRSGYFASDSARYGGIRFSPVEEAQYEVGTDFPRIVPQSFPSGPPPGLSHVRYSIDLDLGPAPMQKDEVTRFLAAMAAR